MKLYTLPIKEGDAPRTVNEMLRRLLIDKKVDAILAMTETPSRKSAFPTMVSDPEKLATNVFTPLLPVSTGTMVSRITKLRGVDRPLAVVLRSCELRALTELVKLNQADLRNIVLIGVDCLGTFPMNTYSSFPGKDTPTETLLKGENAEKYMRSACLNCKDPTPKNADIVIGVFGADPGKELFIGARTEKEEALLKGLGLKDVKDDKGRKKAVDEIRKMKDSRRELFIKEKSGIKGMDKLSEFFDTCVNCHNCMKACPICYCKECLFESAVFDLEAGKYMGKADAKGAYKTPVDSILFHITRFNHMILSCVECGLCEQACPSNIPLMDIIVPIAENAQKEFGYLPGRDPSEQIPMIVYREEEFQDVGE
ncbi:MAG: Coenzyme F420 hydrogenase/dehydrogenase, beta subunit C-terminal domain [Candidatus Thermoplasmatota archaeon]|nr:Coenzyme F420 hydrogenase/dehydrogenase, beta subunit C-terminal domain [Candidatus Thermoplasmatota archaeon]